MSTLRDEYNNLIKEYKSHNIKILTGSKDVDYKILNQLNVIDLSKLCRINTYAQELCNNSRFWIDKYHDENLPLIAIADNLTDWLNLYKASKIAQQDASDSLRVHKINAIDKKIDIICFKNNILNSALDYLRIGTDILIETIEIEYVNDIYELNINNGSHNIILSNKIMNTFLTICYMYSFPNDESCDVSCFNIPLIVTDENIEHYLEISEDEKYDLYTRKGILDCIRYKND